MMIFDYSQLSGSTLYGDEITTVVLFIVIVLACCSSKRCQLKKFLPFWWLLFFCILSIIIINRNYDHKNALDVAHSNHTIGKASGVLTEIKILKKDVKSPIYIYRLGDFQFARRGNHIGGLFCFQAIDLKDFVNKNVIIHYEFWGDYKEGNINFKVLCITKFEVLE